MNCSVITELQKMKNVAEVVYAVRVQRRKASDRLGIAWRRDYNTNDVRVKSVTAGLIDEWNKANPDFKVRIGDTLLEVKSVTAGLIDEWNKANPDFKVRIG